ncbi:oxaloacetate-decarboxylating malate dehydrogenase [Candidatus Berkiella aquae]|uniref:NAD-dependent malic enzyme n=1 Tax=Candidatus Berkiella aquae TaxID=295108 RepID=A0A0Q9YNJ8_9GAMM|nr:NAD-dependent malic enzyme [Candidatus Berkiella aquae]MCS5711055.1 NAD-dependent malic enzyme [Candidatus Berkiella aquae]
MLKYTTRFDHGLGQEWIETDLSGKELLVTPLLNKGTAFSEEERHNLKLLGKLPQRIETLQEQLFRVESQFGRYTTTLQKYIYLNNLHDKNETLFYTFLLDNLDITLPLIYTPGVSAAVQRFSHEFRQPRGLYISYPDRDKIDEILDNRTHAEIDLLVATDGERILGIGDQGIGGMDIPIAKLVVYSLCGVNPYRTIPILLDVGTDNQQLLNDPLYLGWRHARIRGKEYDDFIQTFVDAVKRKLPKSMIHWEDFGNQNARRILETYRLEHCSFNDDMQGTAVVTLAALLSAIKASNLDIKDQRIVVYGAGTAGLGIADQLFNAMVHFGVPPEAARRQFWLIDRHGLLVDGMPELNTFQQPYARPSQEANDWPNEKRDLLSVVEKIHPTILIGCSTVKDAFTEAVVKAMASHTNKPIICPLSNPNENSEGDPNNLIAWTKGKALIATGSPFPPVEYEGIKYCITQCNNALSFPGIGLGVIATKATQVTDNMLWAATQAISLKAPILQDPTLPLLPHITEIPELAAHVAHAVAEQAIKDGVATVNPSMNFAEFIKENMWKPYYRPIRSAKG